MDLDDDELKATRILLGLEKEGIEKNIKNLKEYIKEDDIYTRYKNGEYNELSDFEMFCINHCKDIEVVLGNLDALCDMQRTADIELKNARKINEEHQKENGLLREKIKQLEEENYVQKVALLENSVPKQKIKDKIKKLKSNLKFIACNKDCNKCFDKKGNVIYRGSNFMPCFAYHQIKVLQELLQESEE